MTTLIGTVQEIRGRQVLVVSPDAPAHLRDLWVARPSTIVVVGDRVRLQYYSTNTYGFWYIVGAA